MGDSPADPSPPSCCIIVGIPWKLPCCILSCKARSCINASISGNGSGATGPNLPGKGLTGALDPFSPRATPPPPRTQDVGTPKPETRSAARIQIRPTSGLAVVKFTTHAQKLDRNLLRTRWYFGAHVVETRMWNLSQSETERSGT